MGFYHPATLVTDAARHGVETRPVDVTRSGWLCDLEPAPGDAFAIRLGLNYVSGLHEEVGRRIEAERARRPFASLADFAGARGAEPRRDGDAGRDRRARRRSTARADAAAGAVAGRGARPLGRAVRRAEAAAPATDAPLPEMTDGEETHRRLPRHRRVDRPAPDDAGARRARPARRAARARSRARRPTAGARASAAW